MSNKRNNNDLGLVVIHNMVKNGIATLPRNYELYYSAFSGNYPDLKKKVMLLGQNPSQSDIDEVADQFFPERTGASVVQKAGNRMGKQVESLQKEVKSQSDNLSTFAAAVEGAKVDLNKENAISALTVLLRTAGLTQEDLINSGKRLDNHKIALEVAQQEIADWKNKAYTDKLTKLKNRAAFDEAIHAIYEKNESSKYSLILFDIDHFKAVNDTYGHPFGDRILQLVADAIKLNVRDSYIARYGGEEFAIILSGVNAPNVEMICNRLRATIEKMSIQSGNRPFKGITISVGSCMAADAENAMDLISKADQALYASKNNGRNRATQWSYAAFTPDQTTGGALKMYR
ncbi:GGDEF domain-containing protein [Rhizobium sp. MHM7A]|uniref:GGDEF domain-containing protein n=1 Tax=Rhizobium sp. MHM7A TaxID=2583233 RepID=UPI001105A30F|nr:GGDEF domain-containing protein [Rhizobium sp. MHM7A]TLX16956.1 GGDEF domain-containing protein [Rhizobium sp. MHM7A]